MKHRSVSFMITVALALMTAIVIASSILSLRAQLYSNSSLDSVQREIRVVLDIVDAINHSRTARTWLAQAAVLTDKGQLADAQAAIDTAQQKMALSNASLARYLAVAKTREELQLVDAFKGNYERYVNDGITPLIAALRQGDLARYEDIVSRTTPVLDRRFELTLDQVLHQRERSTRQLNEEINSGFHASLWTLAAFAGVYMLVVTAVWLFATRALASPLKEMASALARFAGKDLAVDLARLPAYSPREVQGMQTSLGAMQRELSRTVGAIRETADTVQVAAAEISQGTHDLAQRTEAQAHQVQTSTLALQGMSAQLRATSMSSASVLQVSSEAVGAANEGGQRVARLMQTMQSIQDASQRIGVIVSTIDSISFQTNILALNAAVEAARAGEQGRGFAVVASEVRSLAQRSAGAAKEIKHLIADTVQRIESGAAHVAEAGEIMQTLIGKVHSASASMEEVETAIARQSREIAVSTGVMTQLDEMTQQNAAMVEESAAASESLKALSVSLAERMAEFRIPARANPPQAGAPRLNNI